MSKLEEDRKKIREATEEGRPVTEIECSQEKFNAAMMDALATHRTGHQDRVNFLLWAEKQIQEEMKKEG